MGANSSSNNNSKNNKNKNTLNDSGYTPYNRNLDHQYESDDELNNYKISDYTNKIDDNYSSNKQPRILCLHGKRTSGFILSIQTATFRYHTNIDCVFLTAPYPAKGPPDEGIQQFYKDLSYYEWYYDNDSGLQNSINQIVKYINEHGPFDGILGFSQGARIATEILLSNQSNHILKHKIKFVILIGGVYSSISKNSKLLPIPSLHVMGTADQYINYSKNLLTYYDESNRTILIHEEDHRIPSIRTGLYPKIKDWIQQASIVN